MDIIRAWKDEEYRMSLTEEQRSLLPDNPAGLAGMELSDDDLRNIMGGEGGSNRGGSKSHVVKATVCILSSFAKGSLCVG
jgi:mersacidin/lichenicidin family type 2 lantibiotic